jgi:predicted RNA methylase
VAVGPDIGYSSVPTMHQLLPVSIKLIQDRIPNIATYLTVLWAWQSDTAVMEGVADAVGGAVIVTVCAATAATKSIIAVETADRAHGAILKDRIRK